MSAPDTPAVMAPRRPWSLTVKLALAAGLVAIGYFGVFGPLARRAEQMDRPLRETWESFSATNQASEATAGLTPERLAERMQSLETAASSVAGLRHLLEARLVLSNGLLEQLRSPFYLGEFDVARQRQAEELQALARERKVALEPAATNGLPAYSPDQEVRSLLWARLHFATQLLRAAIECGLSTVRNFQQLPTLTHVAPGDRAPLYAELPMRIQVAGTIEPVARFLSCLPLPPAELAAAGAPASLTNKPVYFLGGTLARKSAPERPGELQLEIVVSGLVPWQELGATNRVRGEEAP